MGLRMGFIKRFRFIVQETLWNHAVLGISNTNSILEYEIEDSRAWRQTFKYFVACKACVRYFLSNFYFFAKW